MSCTTCRRPSVWRAISLAAAKSAGARFRRLAASPISLDWSSRKRICARCPLYVVRGATASCGKPFLQKIDRQPEDGCGCPIDAKARDPREHCPLDWRHRPANRGGQGCSCKWCRAEHPSA